jgi:hypothetical protein
MSTVAANQGVYEPRFREHNKRIYRLAHWPLWVFVFFIAPGPLTFNLFAHGFDRTSAVWLMLVAIATGVAGWTGRLPGTEPKPYILRFTEDRPNPLYRRMCYTVAWCDLISFALLNLVGLLDAVATHRWHLRQVYQWADLILVITVCIVSALGYLPRTRRSTKGEGSERRHFYAAVWAVCIAEPVLGLLWKVLPHSHEAEVIKLIVYLGTLVVVGYFAWAERLPRTRTIVPAEFAVSD